MDILRNFFGKFFEFHIHSLRSLSDLQSRAFALDVALIRALGGGYREALHQNPESNT